MIRNIDLEEKFNEYNQKYFHGLVPPVKIQWNNRTTNTVGSCHYDWQLTPIKIELSSKYLNMFPEEFEKTLVHEMIHVLYPSSGHEGEFKKTMDFLNSRFPELNITIYADNRYYRYVYACEVCGQNYKRARKMPKGYVCGKCRGDLQLIEDIEK